MQTKSKRAVVKSATPITAQPDPGEAPVHNLAAGTKVTVVSSESVHGKVEILTEDGFRGWLFEANLNS